MEKNLLAMISGTFERIEKVQHRQRDIRLIFIVILNFICPLKQGFLQSERSVGIMS